MRAVERAELDAPFVARTDNLEHSFYDAILSAAGRYVLGILPQWIGHSEAVIKSIIERASASQLLRAAIALPASARPAAASGLASATAMAPAKLRASSGAAKKTSLSDTMSRIDGRSEERRVGEEWRCRGVPGDLKK